MPHDLFIVLLPVAAYLLGAVPFGLLLVRRFAGSDPRRCGSGNIGATNVRRVAGNRLGAAALAADLAKGCVPALAALALVEASPAWESAYAGLVGTAAFGGHLFPVYLKFRDGGKGVATAAGVFLALAPAATVIALLVFVLVLCLGDRVSPGSLAAALVLAPAVHLTGGPGPLTAWALLVAALILWRHRENIRRLAAGREPRIGIRM